MQFLDRSHHLDLEALYVIRGRNLLNWGSGVEWGAEGSKEWGKPGSKKEEEKSYWKSLTSSVSCSLRLLPIGVSCFRIPPYWPSQPLIERLLRYVSGIVLKSDTRADTYHRFCENGSWSIKYYGESSIGWTGDPNQPGQWIYLMTVLLWMSYKLRRALLSMTLL